MLHFFFVSLLFAFLFSVTTAFSDTSILLSRDEIVESNPFLSSNDVDNTNLIFPLHSDNIALNDFSSEVDEKLNEPLTSTSSDLFPFSLDLLDVPNLDVSDSSDLQLANVGGAQCTSDLGSIISRAEGSGESCVGTPPANALSADEIESLQVDTPRRLWCSENAVKGFGNIPVCDVLNESQPSEETYRGLGLDFPRLRTGFYTLDHCRICTCYLPALYSGPLKFRLRNPTDVEPI